MNKKNQWEHYNNYKEYSCFLCVIMSFGEPGILYCKGSEENSGNEKCELKELQEYFKSHKCGSLALKPKIFLIQVCVNLFLVFFVKLFITQLCTTLIFVILFNQ